MEGLVLLPVGEQVNPGSVFPTFGTLLLCCEGLLTRQRAIAAVGTAIGRGQVRQLVLRAGQY